MGFFNLDNIKEGRLYKIIYNNIIYYYIKNQSKIYEIDMYNIETDRTYKIIETKKLNFEIDQLLYIKYKENMKFEINNNSLKFIKLSDNNFISLYQNF